MARKKVPILHPHLCKGCIEELQFSNPYIYKIKAVEVPLEQCDNYTKRGVFVNLKAANARFAAELAPFGIAL